MSNPFTDAGIVPVDASQPVITYHPVTVDAPGRPSPLQVKVSVPAAGSDLPVILLSHGHGASNFLASMKGYAPLVEFWAAHGFAVIQPTHLDASELGLREADLPDAPLFWHDRASDVRHVLDHLGDIQDQVPGLAARGLDAERVAAVGHSLGGMTVASLLGMQVLDPADQRAKDLSDPRIKAGVLIGAPGSGHDLADWARENYPVLQHLDFSTMTGTALVVAGDADLNPFFSERISYRSDAFALSPGPGKTLLTLFGAEHIYGGVSGYDAAETSDEDPERVATLRALVWAYLRSRLFADDPAWPNAVDALADAEQPLAKVETK
ncbi:alpha/beta fold hydrolase [Kineococcus sp. T13]|uniref:alpha/beta hydrolase family protein n=1 Tax=Kineococcus vitellinus TaxID=2696565 RepID=UPI001411D10F|nr:alpha/beta fold hydrolase [Kineococcus vitellinus]NAZ74857.1 alpha/beta fold hydrolase [Kineococcus vitellinus]